ncbi:MAG TPA: porin family protein [Cryomorphaceae bacterium]|nr:porin family protein [Cryomorphaceae bacterium]
MELAKNSQIKQLLIALMVGLFCLSAKAQSDTIVRVEDRYDDKLILEFTNDMWLDLPEGVELRPVSIGFKGHFYSDYTFGRRSNVSFAWGVGISADNVHSNAALVQEENDDGTTGDQILTPFDDDYEYEKNKHTTTYLELPLELRFIAKGRNAFRFAVGFRVGYLLTDKQKIIDSRGKRKIYDFEHVTTFRYGVNARIGVGKIALTGFYSLTPLIEEGKGTQVIPISLGIAIIPFK